MQSEISSILQQILCKQDDVIVKKILSELPTSPCSASYNPVLVLGMHRSGTSVVAEILQAMGVYVGTDDEVIPPAKDNPNGFFERYDIVKTNYKLLQFCGSNWYSNLNSWNPDAIFANNTANEDFKQRFQAILRVVSKHSPFLLKDPRFCLTLPVWRQFLEKPFVVFVYRNPTEVALSLQKRNGFPLEYGIALWEFYSISALKCLAEMDCHVMVVDYSELVAFPDIVASRLHSRLVEFGLKLDQPSSHQLAAIVRPDLNHGSISPHHNAASNLLKDSHKTLLKAITSGAVEKWKIDDVPQLSLPSQELIKQSLQ